MTHCYGHKRFPFCPRAQHLLRTQNVSFFLQKHFVFATEVSRFVQQCALVCDAINVRPIARHLQAYQNDDVSCDVIKLRHVT